MIEATLEEQKRIDEVIGIIAEAIEKAAAFYDCRLVLGALIGQASVFASGMRQAGVLDSRSLVRYFTAALDGAFIDGRAPKIKTVGEPLGGAKH